MEKFHFIRPLVRDLHAYVPGESPEVDFDAVML